MLSDENSGTLAASVGGAYEEATDAPRPVATEADPLFFFLPNNPMFAVFMIPMMYDVQYSTLRRIRSFVSIDRF